MRKVRYTAIGAGTAGLTALAQIHKHTDDFVLVNAGAHGTTSAGVGCLPSKALIHAADDFHRRAVFDTLGLRGGDALQVDLPAVLQRVRNNRDARVAGVLGATQSLSPLQNPAGRARLGGPQRIVVTRADGSDETLVCEQILIATGTHPVIPAAWQAFGPRILTTDPLFEQRDLPQRQAVIGLGRRAARRAAGAGARGVRPGPLEMARL